MGTLADLGITEVEGGYRVGQTPTHYVDVYRMLFNWRVALVPIAHPMTVDQAWCFVGTDQFTMLKALVAARLMTGNSGLPEPPGWNKNVMTGEWRENGENVDRGQD